MMTKKTFLAADKPQGIQTLRNIFGDDVELIEATTLKVAEECLLHRHVDMVICGLHFDDSRMFDLLGFATHNTITPRIPFLIFRDIENQLDRTFYQSVEIATKFLGAAGFVDLFELKQKNAIVVADEHFRRIVFSILEE
jgi:hypothetical protein